MGRAEPSSAISRAAARASSGASSPWAVAVAFAALGAWLAVGAWRGIQLKMNELVRAVEGASDRLVAIERLDHEDLQQLEEEAEARRREPPLPPARGAAKP